ncbi:hypothetical protein HJC23_006455 [Cyclotella cryptica]|uniref:Oxidation resistance protein 1 n=1 Tax=Cyclotella cryptica TaxID=29204 RepID=A0ABD3QV47_9STRA
MPRETANTDFRVISEMDCFLQEPLFDMENDYGFYDDLEDTESGDESSSNGSGVHENRSTNHDPSQILTPSIIQQLSLHNQKWDCLFSSSRDGPSFGTFMRQVRGHARTLVVAKADDGKIYGAYATDPWSGRHSSRGGAETTSFLFVVPSSNVKKGQMSPLAQPSSHASFGSFIPGLDKNLLSSSPTSSMDFDIASLSLASKRTANIGAAIDILTSSDTSCGFKQMCQLGNKFLCISGGDVSLAIQDSFSHGTIEGSPMDRREFNILGFEVHAVLDN